MQIQKLYIVIGLLTITACREDKQIEASQNSANIVDDNYISSGRIEIGITGDFIGEVLNVSFLIYHWEDKDQKYEKGTSISPGSLDPLKIVAKTPYVVDVNMEQLIENRSEVFMTGISDDCPSFVVEKNDIPLQISITQDDLCRVSEIN